MILLVGVSLAHSVGKDKQDGAPEMTHRNTILAGVVFEYYHNANVGLISGIMNEMHPLAIQAVQSLSLCYGGGAAMRSSSGSQSGGLNAIFAETESHPSISKESEDMQVILDRHCTILFALGYRLLDFPYEQPPLGDEKESVNHLFLLVYQGPKDAYYPPPDMMDMTSPNTNSWFPDYKMPINIAYGFVRDFFYGSIWI